MEAASEKSQKAKRRAAKRKSGKAIRSVVGLDVINPRAAGLDLHKETIWACAPTSERGRSHPVKKFGTYTCDLKELSAWLKDQGATTVAMEATGVFWWPIIEHLRAAGFETLLVNAREVKSVKGRPKTDKLDCEWLRRLHACGLLRGSFIPDFETAALKTLWRQHLNLEEDACSVTRRMRKALQMINVRLDIAVSDIVGDTGLRIIEAILAGERDPAVLAGLRDGRIKKSEKEVGAALAGNFQDYLLVILRECLDHYRFLRGRVAVLDRYMSERMDAMPKKAAAADLPKESKPKRKNVKTIFTRGRLFELLGVDLTQIDGVGILTAASFLVNVGGDMSPWPTEGHFTSWLGLSPNARDSGGKSKRSPTKKTGNALAHSLRMAAMTIGRTDSWLGSFYRRLKSRIGAPKAITAVARKLAVIFYRAVKNGESVKNLRAEDYELKHKERTLKNLRRRASAHGYVLVPVGLAEAS